MLFVSFRIGHLCLRNSNTTSQCIIAWTVFSNIAYSDLKYLTLQTKQMKTNAFWAAFFCSLALCPDCFFILAAFSAALACDCSFCCPLAIEQHNRTRSEHNQEELQKLVENRSLTCNYKNIKDDRQHNSRSRIQFIVLINFFRYDTFYWIRSEVNK